MIKPIIQRQSASVVAKDINKFEMSAIFETYPKTEIVTGKVKIIAETVIKTAETIANKLLLRIMAFSSKNFDIGIATLNIPKVDSADNCSATLKIAIGLKSKITLIAVPRLLALSELRFKIRDTETSKYVIPARSIDIVKPHTAATTKTVRKITKLLRKRL